MVNGAGLAMATMDIIKLWRRAGEFSRCGRRRREGKSDRRAEIILSDPNVKGILVNIFGGIMRCDIIASGIVEAAKEVSLSPVPVVVRLEARMSRWEGNPRQIWTSDHLGQRSWPTVRRRSSKRSGRNRSRRTCRP
jgi:hypothetical protein